ncbi:MAG TPA: hypothetical protein H9848_11340 [Candidatus Parabacteroides intestinigallinarum]|uniref:Uncharacterized protein n=1 Tax=Candidatus Parabacteroides intestinigallinarum TaxID=2838722 RepID=A0A9D1XT68_9BACT|nr:hypothetical protein [Candidatus Parabacteroides intestinigallinarum]
MEQKKRATEAAPIQNLTGAKVRQEKDIEKVLDFFRYKVGTTLDCMFATGVLRNCITWYVPDLERLGLLQAIYIAKDRRTHFYAKHYSADPAKWVQVKTDAQLSLFGKG